MHSSYRPLTAAPELHQDWSDPQEERSATWPELFTDLFFVAAISNLSHLFKEHPDAPNAGRIVLYHAIVFFLWTEYTTLKTRFRLRGLVFRCVGLCMLLGLLGLIIGARADVQWYRLLAGGYVITRTSLSCLHAAAARAIPRARALCLVNMSAGLMLAVAPAVLAWQPTHAEAYPSHVNVMVVVAVGEAIIPALPSLYPSIDLPLHIEHMNERLGQLVMLHLGEAVIGFAATPLESTPQQFIAVALAATLVWSLHLNYYHVEADKHSHAYRQSRFRGLLFFYCHWLLLVALLLTGSGLRLLLGMYPGPHHIKEEPPAPWDTTMLLCTAYGASLHLLAVTRAAHYFSLDPQHSTMRSVARAGVKGWWLGWWALLCLWPVPVYLLPLLVSQQGNEPVAHAHLPGRVITMGSYPRGLMVGFVKQHTSPLSAAVAGVSSAVKGLIGDGSLTGAGGTTGGTAAGTSGWSVSVTLLLAVLAGHAVLLTCAESLFAHKITKTPVLEGVGEPTGPEEGRDV